MATPASWITTARPRSRDETFSLRVSAQGQILLQVLQADPRFQSASLDERDRIEAARSLLSSLTGDDYGDARVYLQSYTADGTQAVCSFGYYLSGVEAAAAAASRSASTARRSRGQRPLPRFTLDLQPAALLPAAQAAACLPRGGDAPAAVCGKCGRRAGRRLANKLRRPRI